MLSSLLPPATPQLEDLDTLKSCLGWQLESAAEDVVSSKVCPLTRAAPRLSPLTCPAAWFGSVHPQSPAPCADAPAPPQRRWCCAWRICSACDWTLAAAWRPAPQWRCCQVRMLCFNEYCVHSFALHRMLCSCPIPSGAVPVTWLGGQRTVMHLSSVPHPLPSRGRVQGAGRLPRHAGCTGRLPRWRRCPCT